MKKLKDNEGDEEKDDLTGARSNRVFNYKHKTHTAKKKG
jgi:hypothetical protein